MPSHYTTQLSGVLWFVFYICFSYCLFIHSDHERSVVRKPLHEPILVRNKQWLKMRLKHYSVMLWWRWKETFIFAIWVIRGNKGISPQFLHPDSNSTFCSITLHTKELSRQYSVRVHTLTYSVCVRFEQVACRSAD